jgi:hypothetical protein
MAYAAQKLCRIFFRFGRAAVWVGRGPADSFNDQLGKANTKELSGREVSLPSGTSGTLLFAAVVSIKEKDGRHGRAAKFLRKNEIAIIFSAETPCNLKISKSSTTLNAFVHGRPNVFSCTQTIERWNTGTARYGTSIKMGEPASSMFPIFRSNVAR